MRSRIKEILNELNINISMLDNKILALMILSFGYFEAFIPYGIITFIKKEEPIFLVFSWLMLNAIYFFLYRFFKFFSPWLYELKGNWRLTKKIQEIEAFFANIRRSENMVKLDEPRIDKLLKLMTSLYILSILPLLWVFYFKEFSKNIINYLKIFSKNIINYFKELYVY